jgi:enoyl-CoA hydratase/carnithine racemase
MTEEFLIEHHGPVAVLTMNRPGKRNASSAEYSAKGC